MANRRRMVYSSSSDDENENENDNQQQPQQDDQNDTVFQDVFFEQNDDDDDLYLEIPIPSISNVTLNSTTTAATAIELSDDDFIDVADNLSNPSPPLQSPPVNSGVETATSATVMPFIASDCPVNDELRKLGLCLKREWLNSCQLGLRNSVSGFGGFDVESKAKLCFGQFLNSDMNLVGNGVLPENVCGLHLVDLVGPFVLQVDEVVNISCPLKERYKNAAPGLKRCLKLSMTDGVQRVFGMEYRPIKSLAALSPAGFKVVIRNVNVRRGLLMLVPEVLEILGGSVDELEAARQRVVQEVNKPPRGKRTRTGAVPSLPSRATHAAWPQNGVTDNNLPHNNPVARNVTNGVTDRTTPHNVVNPDARNVTNGVTDRTAPHNVANPVARNVTNGVTDRTTPHNVVNPDARNVTNGVTDHTASHNVANPVARNNANGVTDRTMPHNVANPVARNITNSVIDSSAQLRGDFLGADTLNTTGQAIPTGRQTTELSGMGVINQHSISRESGQESSRRESDQYSVNRKSSQQSSRETTELSGMVVINQHSSRRESDQYSINREAGQQSISTETAQNPTVREIISHSSVPVTHELQVRREANGTTPSGDSMVLNSPSATSVENEDALMVDTMEHQIILSGDKASPFTYLASLLTQWEIVQDKESSVQGKVKCFVTGVKGFQYRGLSKFELQVYIEDGSLISTVFIHHNVVQNRIGYSPEEITAALTSSNKEVLESMKNTLIQFQSFLSTFEGIMLVEMSKTSSRPVVLEMTESCLDINAWQLLHRVKPPISSPLPQNDNSNVISLSP